MQEIFQLFPEVLFIDGTYSIDYWNSCLFIIAVIDNNRNL